MDVSAWALDLEHEDAGGGPLADEGLPNTFALRTLFLVRPESERLDAHSLTDQDLVCLLWQPAENKWTVLDPYSTGRFLFDQSESLDANLARWCPLYPTRHNAAVPLHMLVYERVQSGHSAAKSKFISCAHTHTLSVRRLSNSTGF